jgi:ankyrin repeat protein
LVVSLSTFVQYICLKAVYEKKTKLDEIIEKLYNNQKEYGTNETNNIFWMSVFTSWVAPCTVWANNKSIKTRFLLSSSTITIVVNLLSIAVVFTLVSTVGLMDNVNPPISHCYKTKDIFNATKYRFYEGNNSLHQIISICGHDDTCLPTIRICSENEDLLENADFLCFMTGIFLLLTSFAASLCLQLLSKPTVQNCPEMFENFVIDFLINNEQPEKEKQKSFLNFVEETIKKGPEFEESAQKAILKSKKTIMAEELEKLISKKEGEEISKKENQPLPKMHKAATDQNFGWLCFYNMLGGEIGALNGQPQSSIQIIINQLEKDRSILSHHHPVFQWWIKRLEKKFGGYLLHRSMEEGKVHFMELLLANGHDVNEINDENKTPLHIAIKNGYSDCVRILISYHADINSVTDNNGGKALHISVQNGHLECLAALINSEADLNAKDNKGKTALHTSAENGHLECMKFLIDKGADLNATDKEGKTVLHTSAENEHLECMKFLIDKGADLEAKDKEGKTALHYSANDNEGRTPLHLSAQNSKLDFWQESRKEHRRRYPLISVDDRGHSKFLKDLADKKANLGPNDDIEIEALLKPTYERRLECLKYLIDKGAHKETKDNDGRTPLHSSAYKMWRLVDLKCLTFLIDQKAEVNARDKQNNTPLHSLGQSIVWSGNKEEHIQFCLKAGEELIIAGADLTAVNNEGETPMENDCLQHLREQKPELFLEKSVHK